MRLAAISDQICPMFRYAWPAEMDLMARLTGMRLWERWGWWDQSPFTGESTSHISVWKRPA